MPRNKPRLELALYSRPKHPGSYHYALFVSPKSTKQKPAISATKHHVTNTLQVVSGEAIQPWRYECLAVADVQLEYRLLVRVIIAKVITPDALERILEAVPLYQIDDSNQAEAQSFCCSTWLQAAVTELGKQKAITELGEWEEILNKALNYLEKKREMGRWDREWKGTAGVPMLDLLDGTEIVE